MISDDPPPGPNFVPCDICGAAMLMERVPGRADFKCIKCDQHWSLDGNGVRCVILKHLWPSAMDRSWSMYWNECLPAWLVKQKHYLAMLYAAGTITAEGYKEELAVMQRLHDRTKTRRIWLQPWTWAKNLFKKP